MLLVLNSLVVRYQDVEINNSPVVTDKKKKQELLIKERFNETACGGVVE